MLSAISRATRSYPAVLLAEQLVHQRCVHPGPLVLRTAPLKLPTPTTDRDRTVSRRSEPSSRTALMGEQPNPWDRLQPQDAMSRHRGAKPPRRCELLGEISLLSPGRSEEHTSELQSRGHLVCRLLLEKKKSRNGTPSSTSSTTWTGALASASKVAMKWPLSCVAVTHNPV